MTDHRPIFPFTLLQLKVNIIFYLYFLTFLYNSKHCYVIYVGIWRERKSNRTYLCIEFYGKMELKTWIFFYFYFLVVVILRLHRNRRSQWTDVRRQTTPDPKYCPVKVFKSWNFQKKNSHDRITPTCLTKSCIKLCLDSRSLRYKQCLQLQCPLKRIHPCRMFDITVICVVNIRTRQP